MLSDLWCPLWQTLGRFSSYPLDHSWRNRAAGLPVTSGRSHDCLLHNHNRNLNRNPLRGSRLRLRLRLGMLWDASADKVTLEFPRGAAARGLRGGYRCFRFPTN